MIRAQSGNNFLVGLARENIDRLVAGEPIVFKPNEYGLSGPPITIVICFGETEEKLALELKDVISPDAAILDTRSKLQSANAIKKEYNYPICGHCDRRVERLGMWTDENKMTAIFFCTACGKVFGSQLLKDIGK
jgi:hypothetical protein